MFVSHADNTQRRKPEFRLLSMYLIYSCEWWIAFQMERGKERPLSNKETTKSGFSRRDFLAGAGAAVGAAAAAVLTPGIARADEEAPVDTPAAEGGFESMVPAQGHVIHDPNLCSGCRTCEIVCTMAHEGFASSERSRIQWAKNVMDACSMKIMTCKQCPGAECVAACPTGALHVDEATGARVIDEEVCVGCQTCLNACPAEPSRIRYDLNTSTCFKCDLCGGDPQCVKFCPTGALTASWVEVEQAEEETSIFEVDITGDAAPWAHMELSSLSAVDGEGGITVNGVLWTSHATLFNIVQGLFDITGELFDADGNKVADSSNTAHIEIPEMSSGEFALDFPCDLTADTIGRVLIHVVGTNVTNAPGQEE